MARFQNRIYIKIRAKKRKRKIIAEIKEFYHRDDVGRAPAGKKEVKTLKKDKR